MVSRATLDLHLDLRPGDRGVRSALTAALRDAVDDGRLAPGARLPSSRSLAADLGLARNTVADAYADLVAEGRLAARRGSGTMVAERVGAPVPPQAASEPTPSNPRHDLRPGRPDVASFPRSGWLRSTRRVLATAPHAAFGYGTRRGAPELRAALVEHLARARGVRADAGRIVVTAGAAHGLELLADLLRARGGRTVAVEAHSLHLHRALLEHRGLRTVPIPVDDDGARPEDVEADAVLLTPAHQFPTGVALTPRRRAALVDRARTTGLLVIEDDYDGEFRYDRRPVGVLQGLDPEQVCYLGTASKALAPGLRLGWLVAPAALLDPLAAVGNPAGHPVGALDQLVLADLLATGAYDRHVRERRLAYRRRRDELAAALAPRVRGLDAGLHALVALPPGTEAETLRAAAWHGVAVEGLDAFRHPAAEPRGDALVVGYATPSPSAWPAALEALRRVLAC
ncbi:PLP-dependent aminotransferase family protein [Pseudonocardia xishanensis]|uniref:PLP-dependent aminotransferase family protein n=1 Tax=Pseudonocardia xishanensis TaxID=630995 RepID=A0ABP8RPS7_9PSEU